MTEPRIVPRSDHEISRRNIDPDALEILYKLNRQGFKGFVVGGGVRDLMLGIQPKDFDIATDARPRQLKRLFRRNCRIIGRRFRLAHLYFLGDKIIEVATFRSSGESDEIVREGDLIQRDNVFGTPEEDALRRDLTINGLFYDIGNFSVIDYVGGVADLEARLVRTIGDPVQSFREDPVRILRAIRHATRLGFDIEELTLEAIDSEKDELLKVNHARLLEELFKDLTSRRARDFFEALREHEILEVISPELAAVVEDDEGNWEQLLDSLAKLDRLCTEEKNVSHAVALSALFAPVIVPVTRDQLDPDAEEPHPPWAPYLSALTPVLKNLRIYRRDEERLWHVLGALPRLVSAFGRERTPPVAISSRAYFPDLVEVLGLLGESLLLDEETERLEDFLMEARALPPPSEPDSKPRRRRGRRGGESGDKGARSGDRGAKSGKKRGAKTGARTHTKRVGQEPPGAGGSGGSGGSGGRTGTARTSDSGRRRRRRGGKKTRRRTPAGGKKTG